MPRKRLSVLACDICGVAPAKARRVVVDNSALEIDLCEGHAKPLDELLDEYARASKRAPGYATSAHRCELCTKPLGSKSSALRHVQKMHGFSAADAYIHIRPVGPRTAQRFRSPANRPHRCLICKRPYVNAGTARRHIDQVHTLKRGKRPHDFVKLIEEDEDDR